MSATARPIVSQNKLLALRLMLGNRKKKRERAIPHQRIHYMEARLRGKAMIVNGRTWAAFSLRAHGRETASKGNRILGAVLGSAPRKAQSLSKSSPGNFDTVRHLIYSFGQEYSYTRLWLGVGE